MSKSLNEAERVFGRSLGLTAWLLRRYAQQLLDEADLALTFDHAVVIFKIKHAGEVHQHDIAACLARDKTSTTRWLDDLERKGLVERRADREDRRQNLVFLTARGLKLAGPVTEALNQAHRRALKGISAGDKARVERILSQVRSNLADLLSPPSPFDLE